MASLLRLAREVFFTMLDDSVSTGVVLVMIPSTAASTSLLAHLSVFPPCGQAATPRVVQLLARTAARPATPWPPAAAMTGTRRAFGMTWQRLALLGLQGAAVSSWTCTPSHSPSTSP